MMRASSLRTFRLSALRAARGRTEEKRSYESSPFLPAKVPGKATVTSARVRNRNCREGSKIILI